MIDIQRLRHYVKAMSRARKYLTLSPVLAGLLMLAIFPPGPGPERFGCQPQQPRPDPGRQLPVSQRQNHPDRFLQSLLPPVCSPGPAHGETGEKAPGFGH